MECAFAATSPVLRSRGSTKLKRDVRVHHEQQIRQRYTNMIMLVSRVGEAVVDGARRRAEYRRSQRGYDSGYRSDLLGGDDGGMEKEVWAGEGEGGEGEFSEFVKRVLSCVFGGSGLVESERDALEVYVGRLRASGDVREFVREVCKSESWKKRFWNNSSSLRFVEVCFKSLLGRAPAGAEEIREHMGRVNKEGFEKEIDAIVDSEEYAERFGRVALGKVGIRGYREGMKGFTRGMKLLAQTRGSKSDGTLRSAMLAKHLGGKPGPSVAEITAGYQVLRPVYKKENYMSLPRSTLLRDWAASSVVPCSAAQNWSGLGTPRKTGESTEEWSSGWEPQVCGKERSWKAGWAPAGKTKSYV
eukprot:Plantae.Rhodophyta-Hildenbrandia_rubra.ctg33648.p1 GENE.Plantae.Rhodophyta-Hildenbrandia_rubra.ctg33648~~Plantae.Rhodophyta-Hildenbrandia_rubra.ctg33648.p1  ORF type:complete len:358 (+),score=86.51 Plantae.Rhodophyta-Hildenbrandia_rubra.ctg33648:171-1244(+)